MTGLFLLIVPYGIETFDQYETFIQYALLIVPYGIETSEQYQQRMQDILLIVPYGIETLQRAIPTERLPDF